MAGICEPEGALGSQLVRWRRDFHRWPEPGFGEFQTAAAIVKELAALGYRVRVGAEAMDQTAVLHVAAGRVKESFERARRMGVDPALLDRMEGGATAIVAEWHDGSGPTIALRFDMDSLPIDESREGAHRPFREGFASIHEGWMHACGHDGHMAIGLGVAVILAKCRPRLRGTVRLLFQPAEEGTPGGAAAIAARGWLDDVDYLVCCHLGLGANTTGEIVCRAFLAGTSKYRVAITGQSAHVVNSPQTGRNALLAAASAALALHSIPPHSGGWFSLNVGTLRAGEEQGVTPAHATMEVSFWADCETVHEYVKERVHQILGGTAATWGVALDISHVGEAPVARQDGELAAIARDAALATPGAARVEDELRCRSGDDATVLLQRVGDRGGRGIYLLIGSDLSSGHHTPTFDFDERSLSLGAAVLSNIAAAVLRK